MSSMSWGLAVDFGVPLSCKELCQRDFDAASNHSLWLRVLLTQPCLSLQVCCWLVHAQLYALWLRKSGHFWQPSTTSLRFILNMIMFNLIQRYAAIVGKQHSQIVPCSSGFVLIIRQAGSLCSKNSRGAMGWLNWKFAVQPRTFPATLVTRTCTSGEL